MIVGVARLVATVARLVAFKPTKVMIEAPIEDPKYVERYEAYSLA